MFHFDFVVCCSYAEHKLYSDTEYIVASNIYTK